MELLRLAKKHISGQSDVEQIKPVGIAIIELRLSERIRKGVSQSVKQSVENSTKYRIF